MGSTLIFNVSRQMFTKNGIQLEIRMDLYKIDGSHATNFPEGYRFSWIAFDSINPDNRVLFDCHPPKGPHFHLKDERDKEGTLFKWESIDQAIELFWKKVWEQFGERLGGGK